MTLNYLQNYYLKLQKYWGGGGGLMSIVTIGGENFYLIFSPQFYGISNG